MDTKEYLKNVMDLEQTIYTLNRAIGYLDNSRRNLGISQNYQPPILETSSGGILGGAIGIGLFLGVPIGVVWGLYELFHGGVFWATLWGCVFFACVAGGIFGYFYDITSEQRFSEEYEKQYKEYNALVRKDKERVEEELKKRQGIDLQISALIQKREETSNALKKLYDMNIISLEH